MVLKSSSITIPLPQLFDFNESLWFLDRNLDDCMHKVLDKEVRRVIVVEDQPILISVSLKEDQLQVKQLEGKSSKTGIIAGFVKEWLDMDRDIAPFYSLLKKDPGLRHLALNYYGFRMVGIPDLFETLVWCILGQQINLEFAYRLKRRIVELYGSYVEHDGARYYIFPTPSALADLEPGELRKLQVTTRKAEYITGVARMFARGELSKKKLQALGSEDAMLNHLMKIRGIGEWTANYTVMKSLRGMNCVPYGDAGIHIALNRLKGIPKKNNRPEVDAVFSQFEGWKTYLVYYLWRSLR
jgi:DNA-3-methyladenine glycosylase II